MTYHQQAPKKKLLLREPHITKHPAQRLLNKRFVIVPVDHKANFDNLIARYKETYGKHND